MAKVMSHLGVCLWRSCHHASRSIRGRRGPVWGVAGGAAGVQVGRVLGQVGVGLGLEGQGAVALDEGVLQGLPGGPSGHRIQILQIQISFAQAFSVREQGPHTLRLSFSC